MATYLVMAHLLFYSLEDFQAAFAEHEAEIMADVPNTTDLQPVIQVNQIKI